MNMEIPPVYVERALEYRLMQRYTPMWEALIDTEITDKVAWMWGFYRLKS
jgi:hypothetical protein